MAHKSKTQRAKAAVRDANRKERAARDEVAAESIAKAAENAPEKSPSEAKREAKAAAKQAAAIAKAEEKAKKPKKRRFQFLHDVRAEMKRVTWPTRQDVLQWSGVVVAALLFFGVYTFALDEVFVNALKALAGLGA